MNRSQFRSQVEEAIGRSDKTDLINNALDHALAKVSAAHLWSELYLSDSGTLAADTASVSLASTMVRLTQFLMIDGLQSYELKILPETTLRRMYPDPTAFPSTDPCFGWLEGKTLHFMPTLSQQWDYEYSYVGKETSFADDSSSPAITVADSAIIAYAVHWCFQSLEQHENSALWRNTYIQDLRDAKALDHNSAVTQQAIPRGVEGTLPGDYHLNPFIKRVR